jgi:acetate kinase
MGIGKTEPPSATSTVLVLNAGSSSLKFAVFARDDGPDRKLCGGAVEGLGSDSASAHARKGSERRARTPRGNDHRAALEACFELLEELELPKPTLIGHRVVHGGRAHTKPCWLDERVVEELRSLVPLAPLHLPASIAGIEQAALLRPEARQYACFDTAFHHAMPAVAKRLALPDELFEAGVQRYGFHGLSFEYVMSTLGTPPPARTIIAHLGAGASVVAVKDGCSIDTTMGLTPTGGVVMGTRCGDLDPGVLLHLAREQGYSLDELEDLVNHRAGLVALGGTSDMRELLSRRAQDQRAERAVAIFSYSVKKAICALAGALGGLDVLVFTGGIGEHAAPVRAAICSDLTWFGVELDLERNQRGDAMIHAASSRAEIRVVNTDEDAVIARHARSLS